MEGCEIPGYNPPDQEIINILKTAKNIAIVGLSNKPDRDSYKVAKYLKGHGYRIIPINPRCTEILGEPCYPNLSSVPEKVDVVDIFRKPDAIPPIVDEAIKIGAGAVWMQLGLAHNEAAEKARRAGLEVVMNKCIKIEHARLLSSDKTAGM